MELKNAEELVRRMAAAMRGTELYSPTHPLVQRGIEALNAAAASALQASPAIVVGFIGEEVVVDGARLPRGSASLVGCVQLRSHTTLGGGPMVVGSS